MIQSLTAGWAFWVYWLVAFLGFPLGGLLANVTAGPVNDPLRGFVAGALTGAVIGAAQWLALRSRIPLPVWWILATALGMAVGLAIGVALLGVETTGNALLWRALITGLSIALAQWFLLTPVVSSAWVWIPVIALAWTMGWFVTRAVGVDLTYNWSVFGSTGALTFQLVTGSVLFWLLRTPAR